MVNNLIILNLNLLNGLMLIHPIILYIFYVFYILVFKVNLLNIFIKFSKRIICFNKNVEICMNIITSIMLGCW